MPDARADQAREQIGKAVAALLDEKVLPMSVEVNTNLDFQRVHLGERPHLELEVHIRCYVHDPATAARLYANFIGPGL